MQKDKFRGFETKSKIKSELAVHMSHPIINILKKYTDIFQKSELVYCYFSFLEIPIIDEDMCTASQFLIIFVNP